MYSLMDALRTCIDMGERSWLVAIALLNVALGGNTPVPELIHVIPPGYGRFLKRMFIVDEVVVGELLDDIPFPHRAHYIEESEDKEGKRVRIVHERYPRAFGIYIEYDHPKHGLTRQLLVVYDAGTGSYPYRAFFAPESVVEEVGALAEKLRTPHLQNTLAISEDFAKVRELLKERSYEEIEKSVLPPGVRLELREERVERPERPRHRR